MLARAVSDMSQALRERIDATAAFAADVAHELKNPLASMASAVESLGRTTDADATRRLHAILSDDVRRLDRSITDIAALSRLDAELTRAPFAPIDVRAMIARLVAARSARQTGEGPRVLDMGGSAPPVFGDESQLERAIDSLIDNALSFCPPGGFVRLGAWSREDWAEIWVEDDGPGVPPDQREAIFARFHSDRPDDEFNRHSGLGLAIARTIVDGHNGTIRADSGGSSGARFVIRLALA